MKQKSEQLIEQDIRGFKVIIFGVLSVIALGITGGIVYLIKRIS